MTPWDILGLTRAEADDATAVKRAYARKLKEHRPDRDPEGFRRVRDAYEALRIPASEVAVQSESPVEDEHRTPGDAVGAVPPGEAAPSWEARIAPIFAADQPAGDPRALAEAARLWLAETDAQGDLLWVLRVVDRLALREPELALQLAERIPLRQQPQHPTWDARLDIARTLRDVPEEAKRMAVAALLEAEDPQSVADGIRRGARQVLYSLPPCVLRDAIRMRLNQVDAEEIERVERALDERHRQDMERHRRRAHAGGGRLVAFWDELPGSGKVLVWLLLVGLVLIARSGRQAPASPEPFDYERLRQHLERHQILPVDAPLPVQHQDATTQRPEALDGMEREGVEPTP